MILVKSNCEKSTVNEFLVRRGILASSRPTGKGRSGCLFKGDSESKEVKEVCHLEKGWVRGWKRWFAYLVVVVTTTIH
jgi:hypothetical protein